MNILDKNTRIKLIQETNSTENKQRKAISLKQYEIYQDRLFQFVKEELRRHFSEDTVNEMPIASFINFPRRIIDNISSVYRTEPKRVFSNASEEKKLFLDSFYQEKEINEVLKRANRFLNLQSQTHIYIAPNRDGKLIFKNILSHQLDVISDDYDPSIAKAYVFSVFNKNDFLTDEFSKTATGFIGKSSLGTSLKESFSSKISSLRENKKRNFFVYWDKELNFIFDSDGDIVDHITFEKKEKIFDEDILSPIYGHLPVVEISREKNDEYFVRPSQSLIDFGIQYNAALSDIWHITRMQGYSVAVLKGPEELMPETLRIGPNYLLRLKTNSNQTQFIGSSSGDIDFKFVSPSPDISSSIKLLETMLVNFISSRGIDPKEIANEGSKTYNSALERLIAMVDKFEASKDDFKIFRKVENSLFDLIKVWSKSNSISLDENELIEIEDDVKLNVVFSEPQMIQTKDEKLNYWQKRIELGLATRVDAIMDIDGISKEEAIKKIQEIDSL